MYRNKNFDKVYIISEIHPQFNGDMSTAQTMMLQSKMAGADAVKVQLYDSMTFGDESRRYVQLSKDEFKDMKQYADSIGLDFFASVFNKDRVDWCEDVGVEYYKIASPTVKDTELSELMISTGKPTLISLGMWDWQEKGIPWEGDHLTYFYCVSKYPTMMKDIEMPIFGEDKVFQGYSDHTIDIDACAYAVARGASYLEKHYTLNKSLYFQTEMGHTGGMNMDDLRRLRKLADTFTLLHQTADKE